MRIMNNTPLISIVVPSFNQGSYIAETLQSLADQKYSNLEVVIQDGGSVDNSIVVAQTFVVKYPHIFSLFVEKDRGQAHAINLGFAKTKGEILGFLNSDDTLLAGCLLSVTKAIDPEASRYIVFGRSLFTGTGSPYVGLEHPSDFKSHFQQLAIWTRGFNTIPQPSVFWHRDVWDKCGGLNEQERHVLDYDLFCRFSRHYWFHKVDELWSTYRMHPASKSANKSEQEVLKMSIAVSRRYWGPWWSPLRWRCELSWWWYNRNAFEQARHHARLAEQAFIDKRYIRMTIESMRTLVLSPKMAWHRLLYPVLLRAGLVGIERLCFSSRKQNVATFADKYPDNWIGPIFRQVINVPKDATHIEYTMQHVPQPDGHHGIIHPRLLINGRVADKATTRTPQQFTLKADVSSWRGKECCVEIQIPEFFIPRVVTGDSDDRRLSAIMINSSFHGIGITAPFGSQ